MIPVRPNLEVLEAIDQARKLRAEHLSLRFARTPRLPSLADMDYLTSIDLSCSTIEELPESIASLESLTSLDLRASEIKYLPEAIGRLRNLRFLDLTGTRIGSLPGSIGQLSKLTSLSLMSTRVSELPVSFAQLHQLSSLSLSDTPLKDFPDAAVSLRELVTFSLANTKVQHIPASIAKLGKLQALSLRNLNISELPTAIGELGCLRKLDLSGTALSRLPSSITNLRQLRTLDLGSSQLTILPAELGNLQELRELDISSTSITGLPESIGHLSKLELLNLRRTMVEEIPNSVGNLRQLVQLNLNYCSISPSLDAARKLGLPSLLSFLRERNNSDNLYEAKLVLVGEGNVGKTSLLRALKGEQVNENERTTHGAEVKIHAFDLPHPTADVRIRFNAWDFGGQEVYRVTHQFFFSSRSIYLVIWEPRRGVQACQIEDWLRLIRLRVGEEARVLIVSTHSRTDGRIARIDKPSLRRDFGAMIVEFLEVDSFVAEEGTGQKVGLANLKRWIARVAADLDHMGEPFPRSWKETRDDILELTVPRIDIHHFLSICRLNGLDQTAGETLAAMLDELGYIVYYPDSDELRHEVVIQPEWLTKAIGFVLENRSIAESDGLLYDSQLESIWTLHGIPDQPIFQPELYPFFLQLMERFDVSYRLENQQASLVAQHVSQVRPRLPWSPDEAVEPSLLRLTLVFDFEETPEGLVPWLIVRTHPYALDRRDSVDGDFRRLHWQKGMFLQNGDHGQALVELRGRELRIHTEAAWPQHFLGVIRTTVENLIEDKWPGLRGKYHLRVPCKGAVDEPCEGRFDLNALQEFLADGDVYIRCQSRCRERQEIRSLLFGFENTSIQEELGRLQEDLQAYRTESDSNIQQLRSQVAEQTWTLLHAMGSESRHGPRLFLIEPEDRTWKNLVRKFYRLHFWCEAEDHEHPVSEDGMGRYQIELDPDWLLRLAPYANRVAGILSLVIPFVAAAGKFLPNDISEASKFSAWTSLVTTGMDQFLDGELELKDNKTARNEPSSAREEAGIKALHALLREIDPHFERLGLSKRPRKAGDWVWLCPRHYAEQERRYDLGIET